jgi:hypothetical protein
VVLPDISSWSQVESYPPKPAPDHSGGNYLCWKCPSQLTGSRSARQTLTCAEGCRLDPSPIGRTTEWGVSSVFISLPLTLMNWFGFTVFAIGYLEKGARG